MRSHAKASSAGSNSGPEQLRRAAVPAAVALCVLLVVLLVPAFASAAEKRLPAIGTIEPFSEPGAVAVDQGTNDIYVADYGTGTVEKFDENGAAASFSALGSNELPGFTFYSGEALQELAVDSTSHNLYVAHYNNGAIQAYKQNGEPYEFTAGPGAGTNKLPGFTELCGVAVDANGDIYMGDIRSGVHVYAPDGEELVHFTAEQACNVAVDSQGDVYVALYPFGKTGVEKFTPSQFPVTASTTYTSAGLLTTAATFAIAVDPAKDDVYVDLGSKVRVYHASGALSYEFAGEITGSEGIAVDDSNGQAYAADAGAEAVQVYGPAVFAPDAISEAPTAVGTTTALLHGKAGAAGGPSTTCEFQYTTEAKSKSEGFAGASTVPCSPAGPFTGETQTAVSGEATGLTPGVFYRFRLVSTSSGGTGLGEALTFHTETSPPIESEIVESVGTDNADLSAVIKSGFETATYKVEFGTTTAYGQTSESATIGFEEDNSPHTVRVHVAGLTPGTAYHFRFVATNGTGTTEGADTTFATYPVQQAFAPCSNDQYRTGFGEALSDCRAYEQATPTDKNGGNVKGKQGYMEASSNGDRVIFYILAGLPTSGGSSNLSTPYMASRGPGGWSTDGLLPATAPGVGAEPAGWSEDLSQSLSFVGFSLYRRDSATAAFQPEGPLGFSGAAGFAADTRHVVLQTQLGLVPGVPTGPRNLYDLDHGKLTYVGRIPSGSETSCDDEAGPACIVSPTGSFAGINENGLGYTQGTISRDGSKVFFSTQGNRKIYVREDGERSTWISASQRTTPDPNGVKPATVWAIARDGSKVFFTSCEKLTDDSTAVSPPGSGCGEAGGNSFGTGLDLYSYDTGSGQLTDLSVDPTVSDAKGADIVGVLGASADGSYVYFAANGVLAPGASAGDCQYTANQSSLTCNLYVAHNGTVTFVAPLRNGAVGSRISDEINWGPGFVDAGRNIARVADDGTLLFGSINRLTGYDNVEPGEHCGVFTPEPCVYPELYRYAPAAERLDCVSCNPVGLAPTGEPTLVSEHGNAFSGGANTGARVLARNLSANGKRVFFESPDALLPADTNGNSGCPRIGNNRNPSCLDVYEWEAKGEGSCESESLNGGCLYLISSGRSPDPSYFLDASTNGDDVFFFTPQQLVPGDKDQLEDVYDASAGGGLASQHALTPPTCDSTACVANPPPPPPQSLSSASFSGPGNAKPTPTKSRCPKGKRKVRAAGKSRCVSRHSQKKHHKRAQHKRANIDRGGSK